MIHFQAPSPVGLIRGLLVVLLLCLGRIVANGQEATVVCPTCSQVMPAKYHFCGNCGTNLENMSRPETPAAPAEKKSSFLNLFRVTPSAAKPGGDHSSAFSDTPVPLKTIANRPKPLLEIGQNPFLGSGTIAPGFTLPTGAVWQPSFILYGTGRSAFQVFDDGKRQISEWANRIDLFGNLYLTPTERILVGIRPLDQGGGRFAGYRFRPNPGIEDHTNGNLRTLFFEGDFGELFPNLDPHDRKSLDFGFAFGRQPLSIQDGMMINDDAIDAVSITRSSLFFLGASAVRSTLLFGWNEINRNNNARRNGSAKLIGFFNSLDYPKSTLDVDLAYVNARDGDGLYIGIGATQRLYGHLNSTFRINSSFALDKESAAISNGTLVFAQLSTVLPQGKDVAYLNAFWGIDNYASADRGPDAGGPLGQTGILFAAQGLGNYGAPLGNRANSAVGAAIGYQKYIGGTDRQLVFEVGGRMGTRTPKFFPESEAAAIAAAVRYQTKLNQHSVLILDTFVGFPENRNTSYGFRAELLFKY